MRTVILFGVFLAGAATIHAQNFDPPKVKPPDEATIKQIVEKTTALREAVTLAVKANPKVASDLDIYVKAAEFIVRHSEWLQADSGKQTLSVIDQGMKRAEAVASGKTPWLDGQAKTFARGYRSQIDGSVQPYAVWFPAGYGENLKKQYRLDIMLHGRDGSLTEVKFLNSHNGKDTPKTQDFIQIDIYGRGNNAYRWAGESDVFEAMEDLITREQKKYGRPVIDPRKVVLKGFSMGGAGTWHIGLRHPGAFAVIQPGAGFTTTHGYIAGLPNPLPPHQEACLKIYDALNYAENAANLPIVAYSGEIDKQRLAAENIEKLVKELQLTERFTHLIGPGLEHKFPPEWQQKAEAEMQKYVGGDKGRSESPARVHVVSYMPMTEACDGVRIEALEKQYQKAEIDAIYNDKGCTVKTKNVRCMSLARQGRTDVTIDGVKIVARSADFIKIDGKWLNQYDGEPFKRAAASGPIDHAFTTKFLCVIGTGKALHPEMESAARAQLDRFQREWDKHMRGVLVVKKDTEITRADIATNNLILFGDPGSNSVIAQFLPKLPLKWTEKSIDFGGISYDSATHLPLLIYPNPTSGGRYLVLNSGHTFHDAEFKGTNAQLYPRLGDYAIIKPTPTSKAPAAFEVITAGLFDEAWKIPTK